MNVRRKAGKEGGKLILLIGQKEDPEEELKTMNQGKVAPLHYTHSPDLDPGSYPGLPLSSPTANWLASPGGYPASPGGKLTIDPQNSLPKNKKACRREEAPRPTAEARRSGHRGRRLHRTQGGQPAVNG
ncbi:MAG: hypothetical protein QXR19_14900 [Candidatus Jordarchaeaceae archaeon]